MEQKNILVKKRIAIFVALTYVLAWMVFMLIPILGLTYGSPGSIIIAAAAMFVPASCSILTRLITKEGFGNLYLRPHFKGNIKKYLLVYFGPTALLFMSAAVYFLIFPGKFDSELTVLNGLAASKNTAGLTVNMLLMLTVFQVAIIGPVINIIPTLGGRTWLERVFASKAAPHSFRQSRIDYHRSDMGRVACANHCYGA